MSNALREAALHGCEFYDSLRGRVLEVGRSQQLVTNPYFEAPPFAVRRGEMKANTFTAWNTPGHLQGGISEMSTNLNL